MPTTKTTQLPAHITTTVQDCLHCHATHADLSFWHTRRLTTDYIGICPTTGQEIQMRIYPTPEPADAD